MDVGVFVPIGSLNALTWYLRALGPAVDPGYTAKHVADVDQLVTDVVEPAAAR